MTQAYQKSHYSDYDAVRQSESRPSQRPLLGIDRGVPYAPYSARSEPRQESRPFPLPTPIHDLEQDSDQGSSRKRSSVACTRCRRRKIKCRGGPPCLNCRNAGVEANACNFHRVGTKHTFDLDTSVGGSTPISPYSPVSPVPAYPIPYSMDERSSAVSAYNRSGYPQSCLTAYNYDAPETQTSSTPYTIGEESRPWNNAHRPVTTMGYYESDAPAAFDYPTSLSRVSSNASEPISPLNMSTLQSSLPPPIERRLPAPNLVESLMTPDSNDPRNPISARLSTLSISNPYTRTNGGTWSVNSAAPIVSERRQPSIQDLADASMMLPPVTRSLNPSSITTAAQDTAAISSAMYGSTQSSDGLTPTSTPAAATQQAYYPISGTLPPLGTGMLPLGNYPRYVNDRSTPATGYYNWTQASTTTDAVPVIASIETPHVNPTTTSSASNIPTQTRYPLLHHPRPKILPSSSHAAALEKHDRVHMKEPHGPKSSHTQNKTPHASGGKKAADKASKGSL